MSGSAVQAASIKSVSRLRGARKSPFPAFIEPSHPTLRARAPRGQAWAYEIKADGYRAQLHLQKTGARVYSRTGLDWTTQFSAIADAAGQLNAGTLVIDGEAVVYGRNGLPDFQRLRRELGTRKSAAVHYHAFDLLYLNSYDLRGVHYIERKNLLERLLAGAPATFVFVEHIQDDGDTIFENACKLGVEGVVAKRLDAPYRSGRVENWIKLKCKKSETVPIVAFVEKLGAHPRKIASLYVGRREGKKLVYAGKVRSGYTETLARELREKLDPLIRKQSPLSVPIKKPKATWVEPDVDAEIEYGALTDDGLFREAVFKGLRDDLKPPLKSGRVGSAGTRSQAVGVPRENILQLLPDAVAPSKEELISYWKRVWKRALPHLGHRPLKLVRHVHGTTFYHKGPLPKEISSAVHQLKIHKREGGVGTRLWVDSLDGLLGLVEIGAVELHPWNSSAEDIEHADRIIVDLDPGEGVSWEAVVEAALRMRDVMTAEGFATWPKLSGGKGIHLMAPLEHKLSHDRAHQVARQLVSQLANSFPDQYVLSAQAARRGRIFLDYLRNGRGTTAIGTFSPRARPLSIAAPVTWSRIEAGIRPDAFTMDSPFRPTKAE